MSLLIFAIVVLIVAGLIAWAVGYFLPIAAPYNRVVQGLIILVAALVIASRAGLF